MTQSAGSRKVYLGDGVYADFVRYADGCYDIILTTEDGVSVTNSIVLEPAVYHALINHVNLLSKPESDT